MDSRKFSRARKSVAEDRKAVAEMQRVERLVAAARAEAQEATKTMTAPVAAPVKSAYVSPFVQGAARSESQGFASSYK